MNSSVKFEGALEKTILGPLRSRTTNIWMTLDDASIMFFKETKRSSCIGSIAVTDIECVKQTGQHDRRDFEINTVSKSYAFTAETDELAAAWVKVIQESIKPPSSPKSESICDTKEENSQGSSRNTSRCSDLNDIHPLSEESIFGVKLRHTRISSFRSNTSSGSPVETTPPPTSPACSAFTFNPKTYVNTRKQSQPDTNTHPMFPASSPTQLTKDATINSQYPNSEYKSAIFNKPPPSFTVPPPPVDDEKYLQTTQENEVDKNTSADDSNEVYDIKTNENETQHGCSSGLDSNVLEGNSHSSEKSCDLKGDTFDDDTNDKTEEKKIQPISHKTGQEKTSELSHKEMLQHIDIDTADDVFIGEMDTPGVETPISEDCQIKSTDHTDERNVELEDKPCDDNTNDTTEEKKSQPISTITDPEKTSELIQKEMLQQNDNGTAYDMSAGKINTSGVEKRITEDREIKRNVDTNGDVDYENIDTSQVELRTSRRSHVTNSRYNDDDQDPVESSHVELRKSSKVPSGDTNEGNVDYENIDTSQVQLRKSRRSHVTNKSHDDSDQDPADSLPVELRKSLKSQRLRSAAFTKCQSEESIAIKRNMSEEGDMFDTSFTYTPTMTRADSSFDAGDVFSTEDVLESVLKIERENGLDIPMYSSSFSSMAFVKLKQYIETISEGGFDITVHDIMTSECVEKLREKLDTYSATCSFY